MTADADLSVRCIIKTCQQIDQRGFSASGSTDSANRGGGVITAGSAYAPSSFDPASTGSAVGLGANWHVVEGLYGIDYHDYSTFNELATDDPKSVDDTTFEVTIRKGAKFSDGTEVTADDVVASYNACAASAPSGDPAAERACR